MVELGPIDAFAAVVTFGVAVVDFLGYTLCFRWLSIRKR